MSAIFQRKLEIANILLDEMNVDYEWQNESRNSALSIAVSNGVDVMVKKLIERGSSQDNLNRALANGAAFNRVGAVKMLIQAGADIQWADEDGRTQLMQGIPRNGASVIQLLISAGADINARDKNGDSALMLAVAVGNTQIAQILLGAGADPNLPDLRGKLPIQVAAETVHIIGTRKQYPNAKMLKILRDAGAR